MNDIPQSGECSDPVHRSATVLEATMSVLGFAFLVLTAFALHHFGGVPRDADRGRLLGWLFVALWVPISLEALVGYWRRGDFSWRSAGRLLLIWILPPFRISLSTYPGDRCIWLPAIGWQLADRNCFERLDRAFSIPMLFIALMILPILAVEIFWADQVNRYPTLAMVLDLGTATIWLAFAAEFIVMSAIADKKLVYLVRNWLNLAIILLPFLAFLRGLRITRLLRLGKLGKALKVYRMRGLSLRAWKGIVTLELLERVLHRSPEARLRHLRRRLAEKELDLFYLRERIRDLEADLPEESRTMTACPDTSEEAKEIAEGERP